MEIDVIPERFEYIDLDFKEVRLSASAVVRGRLYVVTALSQPKRTLRPRCCVVRDAQTRRDMRKGPTATGIADTCYAYISDWLRSPLYAAARIRAKKCRLEERVAQLTNYSAVTKHQRAVKRRELSQARRDLKDFLCIHSGVLL